MAGGARFGRYKQGISVVTVNKFISFNKHKTGTLLRPTPNLYTISLIKNAPCPVTLYIGAGSGGGGQ